MDSKAALAPTRARQKATNRSHNHKWTQEEDELLTKLMSSEKTENFSSFLPHFPGKSVTQITERWEKVLDPSLIKGSWTREEDEAIINFVRENGTKNWAKLADILPGRLGKQCRERWRNHLDPNVNRSPWTPEEDKILIEMHEKMGNQWVKIAEKLNGRSDNCVKNRWNSTLKKQLLYSQPGAQRPRRGRPSLSKVPKSADDLPKPPKLEEIAAAVKAASPQKVLTPGLSSNPTPALLSPFNGLRSPFNPLASPSLKDQTPGWSPSFRETDLEVSTNFSPTLFSPIFSGIFSPKPGQFDPAKWKDQ